MTDSLTNPDPATLQRRIVGLEDELAQAKQELRDRELREQAIVSDILERSAEEKKVIQGQLLQSQKIEAIGQLAGGVAHDFNNLLTIIRGQLDLAMLGLEEADPMRRDLDQARGASIRAADLTRQLLLFSRRQPMAFQPVDLNQTVDNLLKMLKRLIGEDITIHVDLATGLHTVEADAGNLEQVLMNLAVNARDAMADGGDLFIATSNVDIERVPEGEALESRSGRYIRLSVRDSGTGIDPDAMEHIFEPFFTTKSVGASGTGLGLSVAYGIVKQHKGWIEATSEPGEGARFDVYLPAGTGTPAQQDDDVSWEGFRGNGEGILLIEDEAGVRRLTKRILASNGYVVYTAGNATEAEAVFEQRSHEIVLVFSDVVLPGQSGIELVEQFRARTPRLKVLLCSGYTDDKSQWPVIRDRGFRFVRKPFNIAELLRSLREVLEED